MGNRVRVGIVEFSGTENNVKFLGLRNRLVDAEK